MIEGEILARAAILAVELVAQEYVEAKALSDTTLGSFISRLGLRTARSYWATMFTRSRKTALMASCHDHSDSG